MSERDLENFLVRRPLQFPSREQSFLPVLLSDSKGKRLQGLPDNAKLPIQYLCQSGATTSDCYKLLQNSLPHLEVKHGKPVFVYVWTGTCDITKRVSGGKIQVRSYQNTQVDRIVQIYSQIVQLVLKRGGRVKFIGIPSYSVTKYNQYKSGTLSTSEDQDQEVLRQVSLLNQHICRLNDSLGVVTLKFNADLVKSHKNKNTINFNLLLDGLHQTELLGKKWLRKLQLDTTKTCYYTDVDSVSIDPQELLGFELNESNNEGEHSQ